MAFDPDVARGRTLRAMCMSWRGGGACATIIVRPEPSVVADGVVVTTTLEVVCVDATVVMGATGVGVEITGGSG